MTWKGFLVESKSYMGYPNGGSGRFAEWNHISIVENGWTEKERRAAELKFWKAFPRAWLRFYWLTIRDWFRYQNRALTHFITRLKRKA